MKSHRRLACWLTAGALLFGSSVYCAAEELAKPVRLPDSVSKTDKTRLTGRVTAMDDAGFSVIQSAEKKFDVKWSDLDAKNAYAVRQAVIVATHPKDSKAYIELGEDMLRLKDGKPLADKAFAIALRLDPRAKADVEQVRAGDKKEEQAGDAKSNAADAGMSEKGEQRVGVVQSQFWGKLTDEQQAEHVKTLNAFAVKAATTLNRPLTLLETKYFLFYSDLPAREAKNWSGLLDRMYDRLAELFAVPKGENLWRGKALVFVFSRPEDYAQFQVKCHQTNPAGSAGMCHSYGDGSVHIAFYRQPNELDFAHVLVHESVHGFLHRYRSPVPIVSWVNEGLAEVISGELVPQNGRPMRVKAYAKAGLQAHGGMGDLFVAEHIDAWQYPVVETLTDFMIRQSKRGYVDFINALKDGTPPESALEQKYKAPRGRLIEAYYQAMGLKGSQRAR